jgi:hypothetical protein
MEYVLDPAHAKERDDNVALARRLEQIADQVTCHVGMRDNVPAIRRCVWGLACDSCLVCAWLEVTRAPQRAALSPLSTLPWQGKGVAVL